MSKILKAVAALCLFAFPVAVAQAADPAPRPLKPEDIHGIKSVKDPQVSPDGVWVAYTVTSHDTKEDRQDTDVWMVPRAGGEALRLTASDKGESRPRWSPDGRWLAFLSGREGDESQVWLLDRRGGEGVRITDYDGGVSDLAWSPDGKRLALIVSDPEPKGEEDEEDDAVEEGDETVKPKQEEDEEEEKDEDKPKPIVIRRLQFKRDGEGYLDERRSRLWIFDLESRKGVQVTSGPYDDGQPVWSPDGRTIAVASNRSQNPDANDNSDIFLVEPKAGATPRKLTTWDGNDSSPSFSPDGKSIVYVAGGDPKDVWYDVNTVAIVPVAPVAGGEARELTPTLDRNVEEPRFAPDGQSVLFRVEDGGNVHLARVPAGGGAVERIVEGELEVEDHDFGPKGELVVLESRSTYPAEVSAVDGMVDGRELRRLTRTNDEFLKGIRLGEVRRLKVKSADGTAVDAFLTLPPNSSPDGPSGKRLPTILRIHGGPVAQYSTGFQLDWQVFAGQGYAVVGVNPRGSSGYGREFSRAIFADWGNKDFEDVMAAVDQAIAAGVADP
ncbi:MAG TPA: prolyl oligopeptidase family serine peptidase, partial [Thermoanaerobaculia bacterium]|nr:prolyl oligopeptidase family serine peptidase [Thermoanaerobaculia bacterium]